MMGYHKYNNSSPKHISTTLIVVIFSYIAIMLLSLYLSAVSGLNGAKKTMERHIGDLKKQCSDYNDFLAADKVKSLVRNEQSKRRIKSARDADDRFLEPDMLDSLR